MISSQTERMKLEWDATYTFDGWSNCRMQSLYTSLVLLSDRTAMVWDVSDLSAVSHTGVAVAGMLMLAQKLNDKAVHFCICLTKLAEHGCYADYIMKGIKRIGARKIGALVTDNAANMVLARKIVTETEGFQHILQLR